MKLDHETLGSSKRWKVVGDEDSLAPAYRELVRELEEHRRHFKAMLTVCRAFEGGPSRISKNEDIDQDLKISGKSESDCKTLDEKGKSPQNQYQPQETPETAILTGYQENGKAAERSESKLKRKGFDLKSSDNIKEETPGGKAENQAMVSLGEILWEDGKRIFEHLTEFCKVCNLKELWIFGGIFLSALLFLIFLFTRAFSNLFQTPEPSSTFCHPF